VDPGPAVHRSASLPLHRIRETLRYGGTSVGPLGGTPMGSWAGAGPGPLGGISGGTLGAGTSGGALGGDGAGDGPGCGPGGCWLMPPPRGFVCCMHNLVHHLNRPAPRVVP